MATALDDHHYNRHHGPRPLPPQDSAAEGCPPAASRSLPILLPVFLLFFILITLFSIYLLHYLSSTCLSRRLRNDSSSGSQPPRDGRGLDPAVVLGFPTFPYDAVRGLREGKCGLECAVCLSEFAAGDVVRLLTVCYHAFHPACIDEWLARHTTCPVCRSDLETPPDAAAVLAVQLAVGEREGRMDSHTIHVDVDDEEREAAAASKRHSRGQSAVTGRRSESAVETEDDDRFTLRLTEAAEEQITAYNHHRREGSM